MINYLPNDIKMYIYNFLNWHDIINIETNNNNLILLIKLYNKETSIKRFDNDYHNKILFNVKYNSCFYCRNSLGFNYLLNICSYCKYKIDDTYLYPLVCKDCVPIKEEREWIYKKCKLCNNFCGYLGILPYS